MRFDWDDVKAERNRQKHGVTFDEATGVFFDPLALADPDVEHSASEERERTLGRSSKSRVLLVVSTILVVEDGQATRRIISARRATTFEEQRYADHIKVITQGGRRARRGGGRRRP